MEIGAQVSGYDREREKKWSIIKSVVPISPVDSPSNNRKNLRKKAKTFKEAKLYFKIFINS